MNGMHLCKDLWNASRMHLNIVGPDMYTRVLSIFSRDVSATVTLINIGEMEMWRWPDYLFKVAEMSGGII